MKKKEKSVIEYDHLKELFLLLKLITPAPGVIFASGFDVCDNFKEFENFILEFARNVLKIGC